MALPDITAMSPLTGSPDGGTAVTIQGSGFTGATSVLFGGASATGVAVQGDSVIVATSPPGAGLVNVSVVTTSGSSVIAPPSQFTYDSGANGSNGAGANIDPALSAQLVSSLLAAINSATSPDALEAQNIILRRIALEGDIVNSRVPAPRNITEIGGYINMLASLGESAMRQQALSGILGVAGPSTPLGWLANSQPLAMVSIANDRPSGAAQSTLPLTVLIRSDFASALKLAIAQLHQYGAMLPLTGPSVLMLPSGGPGVAPPGNVLPYLGREIMIAPQTALANPQADAIAIIRKTGTTNPFQLAARVLSAAPNVVSPDNYDAVTCTATSSSDTPVTNASLVYLAPVLAAAGFYPAVPLPVPANSADTAWCHVTNPTGLIAGTTRLGDELSLLYSPSVISSSAFGSILDAIWDGDTFN